MGSDTSVRIERLDPTNDTLFAPYARIHRLAEEAGTAYPVGYQPAELRALLMDAAGSERRVAHLGLDPAGTPVVAGLITTSVADNLEKAELSVWVAPDQRRRGYGSAMARALARFALAERRTTLLARVRYPMNAGANDPAGAFAAKHDFTLANTEIHRVLNLPVSGQRLDELIAHAAPHHPGYVFAEFVDDAIPDDLLPSYLDLVNALMTDAPTGDVDYESGAITPEMFHANAAAQREQGRTAYRTIAIDSAGRAAAHSVLAIPEHDPGKVFQWGTLVARPHRGHRLGVAVKAHNLKTVQTLHPDRRVIHTWNAASNTYMISVNQALGFRAVDESAEYVRRLDA